MSYTFLDDVAQETAPTKTGKGLYVSFGKRAIDIVVVILSLPIVAPIIFIVWALVMITGGRAIYGQPRVGADGRIFKCWKIRSMVKDADHILATLVRENPERAREWAVNQKLEDDPRITWWGRALRTSSIDELPQLWNVLTGDMSLIGPRPFTPDQKPLYDEVGSSRAYYHLRPGISGLWQVECRNNSGFHDRIAYDETYARDLSFSNDLRIAVKTITVILKATGK